MQKGEYKMNCPKCGKAIEDNHVYCPFCGAKIEAEKKKNSESNMAVVIFGIIFVGLIIYGVITKNFFIWVGILILTIALAFFT